MQGKFEKTKRIFQFYYKEKLTLLLVVEHSPVLFWGKKIATSRNGSSKRYTLSVLYSTCMKHNYPQSYNHSKKSPKKQPNKSILQHVNSKSYNKNIKTTISKKKIKSTTKLALSLLTMKHQIPPPHPEKKPNQAQNDT